MLGDEQLTFTGLLFPGRRVLYVSECAEKIGVTDQHILNLIDCGKLRAINVGTSSRSFYRIPAEEWERYLRDNVV